MLREVPDFWDRVYTGRPRRRAEVQLHLHHLPNLVSILLRKLIEFGVKHALAQRHDMTTLYEASSVELEH